MYPQKPGTNIDRDKKIAMLYLDRALDYRKDIHYICARGCFRHTDDMPPTTRIRDLDWGTLF